MTLTPSLLSARHSFEDLAEQFLLTKSRLPIPDGWREMKIASWTLALHPGLPAHPVRDYTGAEIGYLVGYPLDTRDSLANRDLTVASGDPIASFEAEIYGLGGRFLALLMCNGYQRVYPDACGSLACVYSPEHETVASTGSLIPYSADTADDIELIEWMEIPRRSSVYPLQLTPRHGILRLIPNHYLELATWKQVRQWPEAVASPVESADSIVDEIADQLTASLEALCERGPVQLALTAGQDSRALLACLRRFMAGVRLFTIEVPQDTVSRVDIDTAGRLAKIAGCEIRLLRHRPNTEFDSMRWLFRTGCSVGEVRGLQIARTRYGLTPTQPELVAVIAEMGRAPYWRFIENDHATVDALLRITRCPETDRIRDVLAGWLEGLPALDPGTIMDLFYLEYRIGCWAAPVAYGDSGSASYRVFPFAHRRIIDLMLRLPYEYRRSGLLCSDIIRRRWPELLSLPFNKPVGLLRWKLDLSRRMDVPNRVIRSPKWAAKKLLQKLRLMRT